MVFLIQARFDEQGSAAAAAARAVDASHDLQVWGSR